MKHNWKSFENSAGYGTQCLTCHKVWNYLHPSTCVCPDAPKLEGGSTKSASKSETWAERCNRESIYNR